MILLERSATQLNAIYFRCQLCFRTRSSTPETRWIANPETFVGSIGHICPLIQLVCALYARDCIIRAPGTFHVANILCSRICLLHTDVFSSMWHYTPHLWYLFSFLLLFLNSKSKNIQESRFGSLYCCFLRIRNNILIVVFTCPSHIIVVALLRPAFSSRITPR